jgi:hypothetical protein
MLLTVCSSNRKRYLLFVTSLNDLITKGKVFDLLSDAPSVPHVPFLDYALLNTLKVKQTDYDSSMNQIILFQLPAFSIHIELCSPADLDCFFIIVGVIKLDR